MTDHRTAYMKQKMAHQFKHFEEEYRNDDDLIILEETDEYVLIEDTTGDRFRAWERTFEDCDTFWNIMHQMAREIGDYQWSRTYPLVFDKFEDGT